MRRLLLAACLLLPLPADAEAVAAFHWAGAKAAADAGYAGSRTEALVAEMDPAAIAGAAGRVAAALAARADEPDVAEGLATIRRLRAATFQNPVTAWINADGVGKASLSGAIRWSVPDAGEAEALAAELTDLLHEFGHPDRWSVGRGGGAVTLAYGEAGDAPEAPAADEAVLALDVDVTRLLGAVEPAAREALADVDGEVPPAYDAVLEVLHPAGIERFAVRQFFRDGLWATEASLAAPAPRRGLAQLLIDTPAVEDADLVAVPAAAPIVAAFGLDLRAAYALAREAVAAADPSLLERLDEQLQSVRDGFGVDVEGGILDAFGAVHTVFQDPDAAGTSSLGLVFGTRLRDAEAFAEALDTLADLANGFVEAQTRDLWISGRVFSSQREGVEVSTVPLPGISPTWAVVDGTFLLGLYPQTLTAVLERRAAGGGTILGTPAFAEALADGRAAAGAGGVTSVSFVDLPALAPQAWGSLLVLEHVGTGLASMTSREPVPAVLPPYARVRPLLMASTGAGWPTEEGSTSAAVAPFPGSSLLGGGSDGGVSALFTLPGLMTGIWQGSGDVIDDGGYNGFPDADDPFEIPTPPPAPGAVPPPAPPPPSPFGD
ncbi:hypothetical protein [Phycisphaera mikurensis]|uniref:Uncharacterized protein n=1 Tax=Phycisphaera mikurensis (strain NBRC 102666 / KCTC 22515 / FYK2301M01) TaxID=1142394 RepID=I0IDT4_PHYMF|nr:hypothetical protein [Phycisphaera mikurensis]MBB6441233.1 hypothetical protein [Phycisphaera mikurensis]BAM03422.1 hypothetical protein PSMK_12630 [Phycisphaera mikurensis NBRC 102666]